MAAPNQVQIDLLVNTVNTSSSLREVNLAMRQLSSNLASVQQGSAAFNQMNAALSQGRERIEDINAQINAGKDGGIQGLSNLGRSIAGSFGVATGALGLFGTKNEELNEIINKVNASVSLLSGIQSIADATRDAGILRGLALGGQQLTQTTAQIAASQAVAVAQADLVLAQTALTTAQRNGVGVTAAQIDLMAAQNTLTAAQTAEQNLLTPSTVKLTLAQRALNFVMSINPLVAIGAAIAGLIVLYTRHTDKIDEAAKVEKEYNEEIQKTNLSLLEKNKNIQDEIDILSETEGIKRELKKLEIDKQAEINAELNKNKIIIEEGEKLYNRQFDLIKKGLFNLTEKEKAELSSLRGNKKIDLFTTYQETVTKIEEKFELKRKEILKKNQTATFDDYIKNLQAKLEASKSFNDAISKIETFSIGETNKKALELNTKYLNDQQKIREAFNKRILAEKLITDEEFFKLDNEKQEKLLDIEIKFNEKQKGASDKDIAIAQFRRLKDIEKINEEYQSKIDATLKGTDKVNTLIKARDLEINISQQANKRERTQLTKDLYTIEEEIASEGLSKLKELTDEFDKSSLEAKLVATNTEKNIEVKQGVDQLLIQASADEKILRGTNKFLDDRLTLISNGLDQEILKSSEFGKDIIDLEEKDYADRKLLFGNAFNDSLYALNVQFDKKIITTEQYNEKLRKLESLNGELQNQLDLNYYRDANEKLKNFRDAELNFNSNSLNKKLEQNKDNLEKDLANVEEYALKRQKVILEDPNLSNDQKAFQSVSLVQEVEQLKTDAVRKASAERVKAVADEISSQVNLYGDLGKGVLDALGAISASKQAINTNQIAVENQALEQNYNDQTDTINNAYAQQIAAANGNADAIKLAEETKTKAFAEAARTKAIADNDLIVRQNAINKEAFENSKKLQIAQAIIQTAQSATGAFASLAGIPLVGPVLGGIAAAAAIVSGTAQINTIRKTQYVGQSTSALPPAYVDSSSSGSGSSAGSLASQFVSGFNFDNSSLFGQNYPFPQSDQRVYVLESDITSTQNRVKTIEDRNSF